MLDQYDENVLITSQRENKQLRQSLRSIKNSQVKHACDQLRPSISKSKLNKKQSVMSSRNSGISDMPSDQERRDAVVNVEVNQKEEYK